MTPKSKEIIRRAMRQAKGDDLERANAAFGRLSKEQLQQQWGQSGKSAQEQWNNYKNNRAAWEHANNELEELLK